MKRFAQFTGLLFLGLGFIPASWGQVDIELKTNRKYYISYEAIELTITLRNNSGNTLRFGAKRETGGRLNCIVTDERGFRVKELQKQAINPVSGLVLPAGGTKELTLTVNRSYNMAKVGHYRIRTQLSHPRLLQDYLSGEVAVDVKSGAPVFTRDIGVPTSDDKPIQRRKCVLLDFRAEKVSIYCLKIEDDKFVYCLERLGAHTVGDRPQIQIDARSQIHILVQIRSRLFRYWVYSINGKLKQSADYRPSARSLPRLQRDPDIGRVMVIGGTLEVPGTDHELELPSYKAF